MKVCRVPVVLKSLGRRREVGILTSAAGDLRQVSFRLFLPSNRDTKSHRVYTCICALGKVSLRA